MTRALNLYKKHSQAELLGMQAAIASDPANRNTAGGIFLHTAAARRRLDDIAQAITFHLDDSRTAAGRPVPTDGFSGRKSNRRR